MYFKTYDIVINGSMHMICLLKDKTKEPFQYRRHLNRSDYMARFYCIWNTAHLTVSSSELPNMVLMCKQKTYNKMDTI